MAGRQTAFNDLPARRGTKGNSSGQDLDKDRKLTIVIEAWRFRCHLDLVYDDDRHIVRGISEGGLPTSSSLAIQLVITRQKLHFKYLRRGLNRRNGSPEAPFPEGQKTSDKYISGRFTARAQYHRLQ